MWTPTKPDQSQIRLRVPVAIIFALLRRFRHGGRQWRSQILEFPIAMHDPPTDERQQRDDGFDLFVRQREVVLIERNEVGELPGGDAPLLALLAREPGAALGPQSQRRSAIEARGIGSETKTTNGAASDE